MVDILLSSVILFMFTIFSVKLKFMIMYICIKDIEKSFKETFHNTNYRRYCQWGNYSGYFPLLSTFAYFKYFTHTYTPQRVVFQKDS